MKRSKTDLNEEVAALGDLSREDLLTRWQKAHGSPAPKSIRHDLLVRSAAWHLQARRFGGLSPVTRRALKAAMIEVERSIAARQSNPTAATEDSSSVELGVSKPRQRRLSPGARLIRDWNGKSHVVDVIETGFVFQAKVYKSLTAIAHQITGAHWSGPRFFGL